MSSSPYCMPHCNSMGYGESKGGQLKGGKTERHFLRFFFFFKFFSFHFFCVNFVYFAFFYSCLICDGCVYSYLDWASLAQFGAAEVERRPENVNEF